METYPRTASEFQQRFLSEESCLQYWWNLRWPKAWTCPRCGESDTDCAPQAVRRCRRCGGKSSAFAGTIFQGSHLPLPESFLAIWHAASRKHGVSAQELQRIMGWGSYRTAWVWLQKLRLAMAQRNERIGPLRGRIEVDEAYVGPHMHGKRGLGPRGRQLVVFAIEMNSSREGIGRLRIRTVDSPSGENLASAVESMAAPGSVLLTDGWPGYNRLSRRGYNVESADGPGAIGENLLPSVRMVTATLNRWLLGTLQGGVKSAHFTLYLAEFVYRFNRRHWKDSGMVFYHLLRAAVRTPPVQVKDLFRRS